MNYENIYYEIIWKAICEDRKRKKKSSKDFIYYEKHHIVPRCLDGTDTDDNLVLLTAREHFICHKLLIEIYPKEKGLLSAIWLMINGYSSGNQERSYKVSSREYERLRNEFSNHMSKIHKGRAVGKLNPMFGRNGELNPFYGKKHSEETRLKMRLNAKVGEIVICPHCNAEMNEFNAKQYHFERCLKNPNITQEEIIVRGIRSKKSKISLNEKIKCPYCGIIARISNIHKYHFENCEHAPVLSEETIKRIESRNLTKEVNSKKHEEKILNNKKQRIKTCAHCGFTSKSGEVVDLVNMHRYHFDNCKLNPNRKVTLYGCKYCDIQTENKANITRFHNENCKFKP